MPLFGPPDVAKLKAKGDVPGLIKAMDYAKDRGEVRRAAVEALCQSHDVRASEPLIVVLGRNDQHLLLAAVVALGRLGDARAAEPLTTVLQSSKDGNDVLDAAIESLGQIGAPAVEPLIAALKSTAGVVVSDVRLRATKALVRIGGPAVEPLVVALGDENWRVRVAAARALGQIDDARSTDALIALLKDRDKDMRPEAAGALGRRGDARAIDALVATLGDGDTGLAAAAALDSLAWSPDNGTSGAAYWAAKGEWGKCVQIGAFAVEPLVTSLRSESADMRKGAIWALAKIGDVQAREPLITALEDHDRGVGIDAAKALDILGWKPGNDEAGAAYWAVKGEWDKCAQIGEPAVKCLVVAALDDDENTRIAAAMALGKVGAVAIGPLVAALGDVARPIRVAAAEALGMIDDVRIFDPLFTALLGNVRSYVDGDWDVRKAAAEGLVALYRSGKLSEAQKAKLLAQRRVITGSHQDGYALCGGHTDTGNGVLFPI